MGSILKCALFLLIVGNASAQEVGGEVVYTLADTARARVLLGEAKANIMKGKLDSVFEKADFARRIYSLTMGSACKEVGDSWHIIGAYLLRVSKWDEAIEANKSALNIRLSISPINHMDLLRSYNNLGQGYLEKGLYKFAIENFITAKKMLPNDDMAAHPSLPVINMNIANAYFLNSEYEKATNQYNVLLDFFLNKYGGIHPQLAVINNNLGAISLRTGNYQNSIYYFKKGLDIRNKIYSEENLDFAQSYSSLGIGYQYSGDKVKALEYYQHAISIYIKFLGENNTSVAQTYGNIGTVYTDINDHDKAIEYHNKALSIVMSISGENNEAIAGIYNNLGRNFELKNDLDLANEYMQKALNLNLSLLGENHFEVALSHSNLGIVFYKLKNYDQAEKHFNSALKIRLSLLGPKHSLVANCYHRLAMTRAEQNKMDEYYILKQMTLSALNFTHIDTLKMVNSMVDLIGFLNDFSLVEQNQFQKNNNYKHLYNSITIDRHALAALDYHCRNISTSTKTILAAQAAETCSAAITTNQLLHNHTDSLHYWHESFDYAERSKAYLLYEAMKDADALHIAGIPDNLLEKEYNLRIDIAYQDKKKQEELSSGLGDTDSTVLASSSKLFDLNRQHEDLIQLFEAQYPEYYQAKYGLKTVGLIEVQQSLTPNQTMLQYVVGDSSVFLFLVQKNHFEVQEIKKNFPLEQWVDTLTRLGIYGYHTLPIAKRTPEIEAATVKNYTHVAQRLYEKLIAPVKSKLSSEVIIIPDGALGYIPFETLLSKAPGRNGVFASYPFLLKEHQISYCYSATLWREMRAKQHRVSPKKSVLAFAPFFRGNVEALNARIDTTELFALRDSLNTLKASGDEVALIAKLWSGTPIYGAAASLDTFRQLVAQYRIVHLSTHGKADDRVGDYAYLALGASDDQKSFEKLYARDLYNLELNADLVVLSACETGIGKLRRGEGIVSLARAFAYAGAKSLVTSLWKVDDSKTKDLLVDFYQHLKSGKSKDAALQRAKLDFLNKNRSDGGEFLHPFFWAGFIAIGDMEKMK